MKIIFYILFCTSITVAHSQKTTTVNNPEYLDNNIPNVESIYDNSIDYPPEVFDACDALQFSSTLAAEYENGVSSIQIDDTKNWIVYTDSSFKDTAFYVYKKDGSTYFKKWYRNGQLMQFGKIKTTQKENMRYDLSETPGGNKNYWINWADSLYLGKPMAYGNWVFYYDNGQIASKGTFSTSYLVTIEPPFYDYETGENLYSITFNDYTATKKHGKWEYFSQEGNLILTEHYQNDIITDSACMPNK